MYGLCVQVNGLLRSSLPKGVMLFIIDIFSKRPLLAEAWRLSSEIAIRSFC